jgi:hypothetical protein
MPRYPRSTVNGHDTTADAIAKLPANPDHGTVIYVSAVRQQVAWDAIDKKWYALGPICFAGVPADGTDGTGVGVIFAGALCIDTVHNLLYQNNGTALSPAWVTVGTEAYS